MDLQPYVVLRSRDDFLGSCRRKQKLPNVLLTMEDSALPCSESHQSAQMTPVIKILNVRSKVSISSLARWSEVSSSICGPLLC